MSAHARKRAGGTRSTAISPRPKPQQLAPPDAEAVAAPVTSVAASLPRTDPTSLRHRLIAADVTAIVFGMSLAFMLQDLARPVPDGTRFQHALLALASAPFWVLAMAGNKLFSARAVERPTEEVKRIVNAAAIGLGSMVALAFAFQYPYLSRFWIASVFVFVTGALVVERRIARRVFARLREAGRISRRVAIIGTDAHAIGIMHATQRNPGLGYEVVGFIGDDDIGERGGRSVLGPLEDAEALLAEHGCVGAMVSLASVEPKQVNRLTRRLTDAGYHVALSSSLRDIDVTRMRPQALDGQTLIYVEPTIRDGWRAVAKRVFDLGVTAVALVVSAPVIAIAALAIKLETPGPVFFLQQRVGRNGQRFQIVKLRTMYVDAEQRKAELMAQNEIDGPLFKIREDPRITKVGRILRKLSIDELPQFWNVVRGEMSVVGPRPALPSEVEQWEAEVHERLRVLPGITGMWQVSGRSDTSFEEYKRLDLYYVDNWSLVHDLGIVFRTFGAVVLSRGAS